MIPAKGRSSPSQSLGHIHHPCKHRTLAALSACKYLAAPKTCKVLNPSHCTQLFPRRGSQLKSCQNRRTMAWNSPSGAWGMRTDTETWLDPEERLDFYFSFVNSPNWVQQQKSDSIRFTPSKPDICGSALLHEAPFLSKMIPSWKWAFILIK